MKFTTKVKYVAYGVIGAVVLIPLTLKAVETIPLTFREGDVISANIINSLFSRINDVQRGYVMASEFNGTWNCDTYSTYSGSLCVADGLVFKHSGTITFDSANLTYSNPNNMFTCDPEVGPNDFNSGSYDVKRGYLIASSSTGVPLRQWEAKKLSPTSMQLKFDGSNQFSYCTKVAASPAPADVLTATASGTSVALTWTDQSTDETGFKVQRKTSVSGTWADIITTAANAISYNDTGLTGGTYWYRVIATNSNGDAMSSSEVQAIIQ